MAKNQTIQFIGKTGTTKFVIASDATLSDLNSLLVAALADKRMPPIEKMTDKNTKFKTDIVVENETVTSGDVATLQKLFQKALTLHDEPSADSADLQGDVPAPAEAAPEFVMPNRAAKVHGTISLLRRGYPVDASVQVIKGQSQQEFQATVAQYLETNGIKKMTDKNVTVDVALGRVVIDTIDDLKTYLSQLSKSQKAAKSPVKKVAEVAPAAVKYPRGTTFENFSVRTVRNIAKQQAADGFGGAIAHEEALRLLEVTLQQLEAQAQQHRERLAVVREALDA